MGALVAWIRFAQPGLLLGLCAALLPLIIHLLLRPRPRRVRFPALRMLSPALLTGQRASRVRNWLLLLLRAALLGAVAALLAEPAFTTPRGEALASGPEAHVVILDDSLSCGYVTVQDTPRLAQLAAAASNLFESPDSPRGSGFALVRAGEAAGAGAAATALTADPAVLAAGLRNHPPRADHAHPLGAALRTAARLLRTAQHPRRRITIFSDGAAHAWRDVTPALLAGLDELRVELRTTPLAESRNAVLAHADGPPMIASETAPIPLRVGVRAVGDAVRGWLSVQIDGAAPQRLLDVQAPQGRELEVAALLDPAPAGLHAAVVQLEPGDRLDFDQRRYLALESGPRPTAWLLCGAPRDPDASVLIIRNLLAPDVLADEDRPLALVVPEIEQLAALLTAAQAGRAGGRPSAAPALVVIFPETPLREAQTRGLLELARGGTRLLLLPDSTTANPDWPGLRRIVADSAPRGERLETVATIRWEEDAALPLRTPELEELTRAAVRRRVRVETLARGSRVLARFADDAPALLAAPVGEGEVVALLTSPDPAWSDLGIRAAGLLTLLHGLAAGGGATVSITAFAAYDDARNPLPGLLESGPARVYSLTSPERPVVWVRLSNGVPRPSWPTDAAGVYAVDAGGRTRAALYAVNWPLAESDLAPLTRDGLRAALGVEDAELTGLDAAAESSGWVANLPPDAPRNVLGGLLIGLLALETGLALRKRGAKTSPASPS